jgi:hypothetical protein
VRTRPTLDRASSSRTHVGYLFAAVIVGGIAAFSATVVVRHGREAVYDIPPVALVVALAATALTLVGAAGMVAVRRHDVALLSAVVALLMVLGVLALFSVGLLFVLVGGGLAVVLARRSSGCGPWPVASGIAMAVGVAITGFVALQPPMVSCMSNGTRISSSVWSGGATTGSGTGPNSAGYSVGTFTQGSATYSFICRDGRLVEFRSVADS